MRARMYLRARMHVCTLPDMPATPSAPAGRPARRTQQERSDATRTALLDATLVSIVELGYAKTTTAEVCERAGLSRGAHTHHFGTRGALVAAAIEHFGTRLGDLVEERAEELPDGPDRSGRALDLLWEALTHELFLSEVDIRAAARTDPELMLALEPVERELMDRAMQVCRELFRDHRGRPDFDDLVDHIFSVIRGLVLVDTLQVAAHDGPGRWPYARGRLLELLERPESRPAANPLMEPSR